MPIGSFEAVPYVASSLLVAQPRTVLDLGMGFGFYGVAVRTWVDLGVRPWRTYVVGVEGFSAYRNPVWDLYDLIYEQPMETFLANHEFTYDMVIAADIIEHLDMPDASQLIAQMKQRVAPGGRLIVVTPAVFFEQPAVYGNSYEVHRSYWSVEDLCRQGLKPTFTGQNSAAGIPTHIAEWEAIASPVQATTIA